MHQNHCRKPSLETMKHIIVERLAHAERLIKEDLKNGFIRTEDTASFSRLHNATDPNCYISDDNKITSNLEREHLSSYRTEDWIEYWEVMIEAMDAWLKGGMNGNIVDQFDDKILIDRF